MKLLLVLSAVLAAAAARPGYLGGAVGVGYYGAPALGYSGYAAYGPAPVAVGPGGYLVDTPEVAAARAAHFAAVAEIRARDAVVNAADAAHGAYGLGYGLGGLGYGFHH